MDPRFQDPNWQQGGRFNPVPGYPTNNQLFGIQSWLNNIQSGIGSGQINSNNAGQYSQLLGQLQNTLGGFSSSSMPQLNANAWGAMMNASSPLFNGFGQASAGPDISGLLGSNSNLFNDWMQQFRNYQDQRFGLGNQILDSQYNTALGQQSQQYNQASQEINRQREGAQQMAQYSASILNPYGGPAGASAAQGYSGAINQLYNTQAQNLQAQADQARQALQSGNIQAHMQLQAQMLDSQQQFQQNMQNFMLGLNQQDIQNRQFQYGVLDKAQDNLRQFIQMSGVPQSLIGKDPSQWSMQEVAPYLQYAISQGISPDRAMQIIPALLSGETLAQQRLELDKDRQLRLALATIPGSWSIQTGPLGEMFQYNAKTGERRPLDNAMGTSLSSNQSLPQDVAPAFTNALSNINTRYKYTNPQQRAAGYYTIQNALSSGDLSSAQLALENHIYGGLSVGAQDILRGSSSLISNLGIIKSELSKLKAQGINTGIYEGSLEKALQAVGNTSDTRLAKLRSALEATKFSYINQISGKQFTDNERKAYNIVLPDISNWGNLNLARIEGITGVLKNNKDTIIRDSIGAQNFNSIYGAQAVIGNSSWRSPGTGRSYIIPTF